MRVGVSSRGNWWVSMGPVGWLLFGWLYLAALLLIAAVWLLYAAAVGVVWLIREGAERLDARHARQETP